MQSKMAQSQQLLMRIVHVIIMKNTGLLHEQGSLIGYIK